MVSKYPIDPGSLTATDAKAFLADPTLIGEQVVLSMGADMFPLSNNLLAGRASLAGGSAVVIPRGTSLAAEGVRDVAPGAEYPEVSLFHGEVQTITALKRGYKTLITDEMLSRDKIGVTAALNDAITYLGNGMQVDFESLSAAAVASAAIPTFTGTSWAAGGESGLTAMATDVIKAFDQVRKLRKGFVPSMVAVTMAQWAVIAPMLSRAAGTNFGGLTTTGLNPWSPETWFVSSDLPQGWQPTLVDPLYFGGVAHEAVDSEGTYVQVGPVGSGFEVSAYREQNRDTRVIQVRKTDVPYMWNPDAALTITGTGL